jgi:hypothetical protein
MPVGVLIYQRRSQKSLRKVIKTGRNRGGVEQKRKVDCWKALR